MKIAIITHYYNSKNYGGNLQSYALCKFFKEMGFQAEQISFERRANRKNTKVTVKKIIKKLLRKLSKVIDKKISGDLQKRNARLDEFNKNVIPHTNTVYNENTIAQCVDSYDAFITGSDQVWHPVAYCSAYGLEFVPSNKIKMSYAASLAIEEITDEYREVLKKSLSDFQGVSVRESSAVALLSDIVTQNICVSLDPVFLLSKESWDDVCSDYRVESSYVFCYFLGDNKLSRTLTQQYAEAHNLKILTLPHLLGKYRKCDSDFGDERLYDVSPEDFIALIKNAEIVFTDSFHATVFSIIYEKEFVVFNRDSSGSMKTRLNCILDEFNLSDRFCNSHSHNGVDYIDSLAKIDFIPVKQRLEHLKSDSIAYFKNILESHYEDKSN